MQLILQVSLIKKCDNNFVREGHVIYNFLQAYLMCIFQRSCL